MKEEELSFAQRVQATLKEFFMSFQQRKKAKELSSVKLYSMKEGDELSSAQRVQATLKEFFQ